PPIFSLAHCSAPPLHPFPTRRSSDLPALPPGGCRTASRARRSWAASGRALSPAAPCPAQRHASPPADRGWRARLKVLACSELNRSEEHTSELQSRENLVCRLLLEKKK